MDSYENGKHCNLLQRSRKNIAKGRIKNYFTNAVMVGV